MLSKLKLSQLYFKDTSFVNLMTKRIYNVLLIANPYDAFMLEDDGRIDEKIFNEYYLDYRDRGIIGSVFSDSSDLGYEEAWSLGYIKNGDTISERYFDYDKFGEDLVNEDENYLELDDGRVVSLNY